MHGYAKIASRRELMSFEDQHAFSSWLDSNHRMGNSCVRLSDSSCNSTLPLCYCEGYVSIDMTANSITAAPVLQCQTRAVIMVAITFFAVFVVLVGAFLLLMCSKHSQVLFRTTSRTRVFIAQIMSMPIAGAGMIIYARAFLGASDGSVMLMCAPSRAMMGLWLVVLDALSIAIACLYTTLTV